jgi:hypothetical protein
LFVGVPNEIIQRAANVLEDILSKRPIKRVIWDKLAAKDQEYRVITFRQIYTFLQGKTIYDNKLLNINFSAEISGCSDEAAGL